CRQEANGARKRRGRSTLSATARARVDRDARSRSTRVHSRSNRTWRERCERRSSALVGDASAAFVARASKAIDRACLHVESSQIPTRLAARQRRVLRGDRRSERSAADDLIYLPPGCRFTTAMVLPAGQPLGCGGATLGAAAGAGLTAAAAGAAGFGGGGAAGCAAGICGGGVAGLATPAGGGEGDAMTGL